MIIAAYDFGTTGCKASFFHEKGHLVSTAYREYPTYFPQNGWVVQNPEDWKLSLIKTTEELLEKSGMYPGDIACLCFSGHMMGCVPVDGKGVPLTKQVMLWADTRSREQADRLIKRIGWERFYYDTGGGLDVVLYPAAKIPWIKENQSELYNRTAKFIGTKDVICAWLTGNIATDFSEASDVGLLHLRDRRWHIDFLKSLGIDEEKMPQLLPSTEVIGNLKSEIAQRTGLLEGTPVILGGGDVSCGAAGAGAVRERIPYMCIGSAGWVAVANKEPIIDLTARSMSLCHVVPDLYTSQIIMYSAGGAYKWIRDEIFLPSSLKEGSVSDTFTQMDRLAAASSPGSGGVIFMPYLIPGGAPHYDLSARGAFLGLSITNKKGDMIRATLEGVAYNVRLMVHYLEREEAFPNIRIIGGGASSPLWRQIFADILDKDVLTLSAQQEANTLGAALVGGVGIGLLKDFTDIEKFNCLENTTSPNEKAVSTYKELIPVFEKAFRALKTTNEILGRISSSRSTCTV